MKIAFITGGAAGLGLEWCKQLAEENYKVILSARTFGKAEKAALSLIKKGLDVYPYALEVGNERQVSELVTSLDKEFDKIDLIVNNAGINSGSRGRISEELRMKNLSLDHLDAYEVLHMLHINAISPIIIAKHFRPLLEKSGNSKIINIGSWLGSISLKKTGGNYSYAVSKSALNMMNRALAFDLQAIGVTSVVVNPGWVQTNMGGSRAEFTPEQSVHNLIKNVLQKLSPEDTGKFFNYDGEEHPW